MNKKLSEAFCRISNEYRSIPFWSWNNFLDKDELVRQINDMKAAGIGGFIIHARTGLKEEYLGEKWFACIDTCLKRARELGMDAWIYDENGWPSGFVGGKLLENEAFRARYLEYSQGEFDRSAYAQFVRTGKGFERVTEPCGAREYDRVYLRVSPANSDILNPAVVDAFIEETHEQYYARFKECFGREFVGFFTDEPQYYRWGTPYSPCAEEEFSKDGEDIRDGLIWLFVHDERGYAYRLKYYGVLNKLYCENFYRKLYDWCSAHNCKLTGHSVEEGALFAQMYGGAAVMPTYEYEHIPAIDWLGRDCGNALAPKQAASAAAQLGKKFILTETYGCAGFDVTPRELKSIGDFQYFYGITNMCQHLYPYSMAGRGKTDHPPVFSSHGNWGGTFGVFNEYFARLGYLIAETKEQYDVAVVHPIRDIWLDYIRSEDYFSVKETEKAFEALLDTLARNGICYHLLDESLLEKYGRADGDALLVGRCRYSAVIVPQMRTMHDYTYRLLQQYKGKLLMLGTPCYLDGKAARVSLFSNVTFDELIVAREIKFSCEDGLSFCTHRKGELGEFLFVKNNSRTEKSRIRFNERDYVRLNLETLAETAIEENLILDAGEGVILMRTEQKSEPKVVNICDVSERFAAIGISANYLVLDYAQIAKDGEKFSARRAVSGIFEDLLREDYKGRITVRQSFTVKEIMPIKLVMERCGFDEATLNGGNLVFTQSTFDVNFLETDITPFLRKGENELLYTLEFYQHDGVHFALFNPAATESLRNCLYYDTSLEPTYLRGDFAVNSDMSLERTTIVPAVGCNLVQEGYPFFRGEYRLTGNILWDGKGSMSLSLTGRYHVAEFYVNGHYAPLVLSASCELTPFLKTGENQIEIVVRSSLRNLFGPHHYRPESEPMGVSPYHFEFRGHWQEGRTPDEYTDEYHSVPFGIEKIELISEK